MLHLRGLISCIFMALALVAATVVPAVADTVVSLDGLLEEMVSLDRLASWPSPAYVARQFSSYDQRSTDPAVATEENWFANGDRGQHLRVEENNGRAEYVLMDAAGPGAVVRFWSANPQEGGIVRFYLDGAEEPVIEMPLYVFLGGKAKPFIAPMSGERGRGWNCYLPIPYAKHCKVTISEGDIYYHINYRTYAPGTTVTTFSMGQAESLADKIRSIAEQLKHPETLRGEATGMSTPYTSFVDAGLTESMYVSGPGAISRITCRVQADDAAAALRGCLLTIAFDDLAPAVCAPLGDFFGTAPGVNPFGALPCGALEDGTLYSHWVMPFKEGAEISVINHTGMNVQLTGEIVFVARPWTEESMYFHAKWRGERDIATRPMRDWNYMTATGKGRFAGVMLHVSNPVPQWWGEGDEKIYVDGEVFPSHFGTGTEDYFSYAWCDATVFTHAYHNQPRCDGPGNYGNTCVSRFHILDDIPFTSSFRFDMEVWHWADTRVAQSVCAYWYAAPGAEDGFQMPDQTLLTLPELPGMPEPKRVAGALEGEEMEVVGVTGNGLVIEQTSSGWSWSNDQQLWWRDGAPGDRLSLGFDAPAQGNYEVFAVFTKASDYGKHALAINGNRAGNALDFYNKDGVVTTGEVSLGTHALVEGRNQLDARIVGAHPDAEPAHMFGLDYLRLEAR